MKANPVPLRAYVRIIPRPVRGGNDATPRMSFSELDATPFGESC